MFIDRELNSAKNIYFINTNKSKSSIRHKRKVIINVEEKQPKRLATAKTKRKTTAKDKNEKKKLPPIIRNKKK